ncbi:MULTISPECIES: hypothetical protein [unclassified Microcystis]|nr:MULTISPECIES: hypothetical protein [unclassified Microcystis]MCZ8025713.1 hypothetical protein [Microcystis sp. LE19-10.1B]MCZ8363043.1 hypothetical protein [Microcystis sp. LE19-251.1A]MDJ0603466.1 hypothetical protein [Microcystis sp. M53602_WE12]
MGKTPHPTPHTPHPAPRKSFFSKPYVGYRCTNQRFQKQNQ